MEIEARVARLEAATFPGGITSSDQQPTVAVIGTDNVLLAKGERRTFQVIGLPRDGAFTVYTGRDVIVGLGVKGPGPQFELIGVDGGPAGANAEITVQAWAAGADGATEVVGIHFVVNVAGSGHQAVDPTAPPVVVETAAPAIVKPPVVVDPSAS